MMIVMIAGMTATTIVTDKRYGSDNAAPFCLAADESLAFDEVGR